MSNLIIPSDPGGIAIASRSIMAGSPFTVSSVAETDISPSGPSPGNFGLLQKLEAVCTVAGAVGFEFAIKSRGFPPVMRSIMLTAAPAIGDRISVEFPTPLRSGGTIVNILTAASPNATTAILVTTEAEHGLVSGNFVDIAGSTNPGANGSGFVVKVNTPTTFSLFTSLNPETPVIDVTVGAGGTAALFTASGVFPIFGTFTKRPSPGTGGRFSIVASAAPGTWLFSASGFFVPFPLPFPIQSTDA
jgi:hypothetical protein